MSDLVRSDNDFTVNKRGDFEIDDGGRSVAQRVIERLRSFSGEWFLDDEGLPYFQDIFGKSVSYQAAYALVLDTIAATPGVAYVNKFEMFLDTETRQYKVEADIQSVFGTGERFDLSLLFGQSPDIDLGDLEDSSGRPLRDSQNVPIRD